MSYFHFYSRIFFSGYNACGILAPKSGIKPVAPAAEAQSPPNHWTAREVPIILLSIYNIIYIYESVYNFYIIFTYLSHLIQQT